MNSHLHVLCSAKVKGRVYDSVVNSRGVIQWSNGWRDNLIVNGFCQVLAALVKGDIPGSQINYGAIGAGDWDEEHPPNRNEIILRKELYKEIMRVKIPHISYIDKEDRCVQKPTNRLEIHLDFESFEKIKIKEFGIFSGGSKVLGSGTMINHYVHPAITLQAGYTLHRTVRFTFQNLGG